MPNIVRPGRVPLPGQSATGFKPNPWNVQKRYIAPEWRWAWGPEPILALINWQGGGDPQKYGVLSQHDWAANPDADWKTGPRGAQYEINNATDVYVTANPDDDLTDDVRLAMFVAVERDQDTDSTTGILSHRSSFAQGYHGLGLNVSELSYFLHDGAFTSLGSGHTIDTAARGYQTIGVLREPGGDFTFLVDGEVVGTASDTTIPGAGSHGLAIGQLEAGAGVGNDFPARFYAVYFWMSNPSVTVDSLKQLHRDPFGPFRPAQQVIVSVPGGADVTLTADSGSYSTVGSDADLLRSLLMSGDAGTYSVTGSDADLLRALQMTADAGSYSVTGQTADLLRALLLDAESGTYTVTGSAADLIVSGALTMTADAGSYSVSGADADLLRDLQFTAESGSYTVTGQPADLMRALLIAAEAGGYNVTGQDVDVLLDRILSADAGTYSLSGQDADLVLSAAFKALNIAVSVDQPLDLSASVDQPLDMDADVDQPLDMDVDVEPQE